MDWPSTVPLAPFDAANADLLRNVAPKAWTNPVPKKRYHLVVVGAGTGGLVSAIIAAGLGAKVALVERHMFGGDCLNFGCVPSKAVISAARSWHAARSASAQFGGPAVSGEGDFSAVMTRMRTLRASLSDVDSAERFRSLGIDVFFGDASFADPHTVQVRTGTEHRTLKFRRAIVATGARASVPPIPGLSDTPYLTNDTVFSLTTLPRRLIVLGGGPIGAELAQSFARFGSTVTVVHADPRLLPRESPDASAVIARAFDADGITVHNNVSITAVQYAGGEFTVTVTAATGSDTGAGATTTLRGDHLLVATGRRANVESLGLEAAGIATTHAGITVNDRLRTSNRHVFAVGDVSSPLQFTHVADAHARLAVPNALFFGLGGGRTTDVVVPRVTYTAPEVATVGLTDTDAAERRINVDSIRIELAQNDRAQLDGTTDGYLVIHVKRGSDTILGGTLVAKHAGEMIGELAVAMQHGIGLGKLGATIHAYPTQSEVFRRAADAWRRRRFTPLAKRVFNAWFRMFS